MKQNSGLSCKKSSMFKLNSKKSHPILNPILKFKIKKLDRQQNKTKLV